MYNISDISQLLSEYDLILLVEDESDELSDSLYRLITNAYAHSNSTKRICFISSSKCKDVLSLFYTYEFSDKIKIIGKNRQHGGLYNLLTTGLLTEDEIITAMLH